MATPETYVNDEHFERLRVSRTCHGRSQSSGMGNAPVQHPSTAPTAGYTIALSTGVFGLTLYNQSIFKDLVV
jgi:hypothetical protein